MTSNDEGSTIMTDNTKQTHVNKQSQLFQPGSPNKRKSTHSHTMNLNSANRRKRKQPRTLPRQSQQLQHSKHLKQSSKQQQLSPKEQQNPSNNTDHIPNSPKQDNSNMNEWKLTFDEQKNKKSASPTNSANDIQTQSFGKFFETLSATSTQPINNNENEVIINKDKLSVFGTQNNPKPEAIDYNILEENKSNEHCENDAHSMANLLHSQFPNENSHSQFNEKRAPFIDEQLTGIFDELDMEICATQQNMSNRNHIQSDSTATSPIMLNYNNNSEDDMHSYSDDYKQPQIQYQQPQQHNETQNVSHCHSTKMSEKKRSKKSRKNSKRAMDTPKSKYRQSHISPVSDVLDSHSNVSHNNNRHYYVHPNGKKMSEESFQLMQQCLSGLEKAKYVSKQTNATHHLSKIQENICKNMRVQSSKNRYDNSDEKLSMDNIHISPAYSAQSPHEQTQHHKYSQSRNHKYSQKKRSTPKHKYYNTHFNQNGNVNNNYSFQNTNHCNTTNIIVEKNAKVRRKLSFGSQHTQKSNDSELLHYEYGMSSPQIIEKQKRKICRTNQEISDLQHELNCVYNTLNAVQKNRNKLFHDIKSMRSDYAQQINSIHRQYHQFKQQTCLLQKEQREVEYDLQQQNKYQKDLTQISVSPAKSPKKSNRKQQYYQHKR